MSAIIRVENVSKRYENAQRDVLQHVNLSIEQGEFVSIMGPSGSGKSTLLYLMGALDIATEGNIYLGSQLISDLNDKALSKLRRSHIGFVFQFYNLMPILSALENVAMPLILDGVKRKVALARAEECLELVGLKDHIRSQPNQLSGGEQQRVAIARAIVASPKIILADEPTGALDTGTGDEIVSLLRYTVEQLKHTVVMVTHDPRVAANTRRIINLRDGHIRDDNTLNKKTGVMADRVSAGARR